MCPLMPDLECCRALMHTGHHCELVPGLQGLPRRLWQTDTRFYSHLTVWLPSMGAEDTEH